ncbi:MAG TPA: tandem-95 repeat protein, partial [Symbiobacteriaceae bacterium]|nr:tandem-95 repeat protein [Symbiobacteriaceae bacterium]
TLTLNANGSFQYVPVPNYFGSDSFTYTAGDGSATSNTATVNITVNPVSEPPIATADGPYTTAEDTLLTMPAPGVLANDVDVDGDPITAVLKTNAAHGTVTLNSNGSFTYMPALNYNGPDSFTYAANDGTTDSNTVTVTLNVTPVNDAPVAVNNTYSTPEDTVLTIAAPGLLGNDTDVDGNPLAVVVASVSTPTSGSVTVNADGSFTYTPVLNYNGSVTFTYQVTDGSLQSAAATVTVNVTPVNDAPVANNDGPYTTQEDTALTVPAPGVLANDTDVDGNPLTASVVTPPAHGSVVVNPDGSFTYTPTLNYNGPDSFTYRAYDGTAYSGNATVTLNVTPVNDAPTAVNDAYSTAEDTPLTIAAPGLLSNDTDVEGSALTVVVATVTAPTSGSVTVNANGSFTYTPALNFNGTATFTYKVTDGALQSNAATVTITVTPVNDAPVANNDSYTTAEDTPLNVAAPGVLSNDTDVDGPAMTAVLVSGPSNGTLTLNSNGSFIYTPNANYSGPDSFTYRASDGSLPSNVATVTLNVTAVNDAPVANNDTYPAFEDTPLTIAAPGLLTNDTDVDGTPITVVVASVTAPSSGTVTVNANGSFTYTPALNFNGTATFTYKVTDGSLQSAAATVTINITAVNDAPSFTVGPDKTVTENAGAQTFAGWATAISKGPADEAGQTVTFQVIGNSNPSLFSVPPAISPSGTLTFTPATNAVGSATITVNLRDSGGTANGGVDTSASQTFTIWVEAGTKLTVPDINAQYGQTVTVKAVLTRITTGAAISGQPVALTFNGTTYNLTTDGTGTVQISYQIVDLPGSTLPISASFAGVTNQYAASNGSGTLTVVKSNTTLALYGKSGTTLSVDYSDFIGATLTSNGLPVAGKTITFTIAGNNVGTAQTDANGFASPPFQNQYAQGNTGTIVASFAGDTQFFASSDSATGNSVQEDGVFGGTWEQAGGSNNYKITATFTEIDDSALPGGGLGNVANAQIQVRYQVRRLTTLAWTTCATYTATPTAAAGSPATWTFPTANCSAGGNWYYRITLVTPNSYYTVPDLAGQFPAGTGGTGTLSVSNPVAIAGGTTTLSVSYSDATPLGATTASASSLSTKSMTKDDLRRFREKGKSQKPEVPPGLVGKPVAFYVDGQLVGEAPIDADGEAHLPFRVDLPAGQYKIEAKFKDQTENGPAGGTGTLTVQPRVATLTYGGDVSSQTGTVALRVTVADLLGGYDITRAGQVRFAVTPPEGEAMTFEVPVSSDGTAAYELTGLAPGTYQVVVSLPDQRYYWATPVTVTVVVGPESSTRTPLPTNHGPRPCKTGCQNPPPGDENPPPSPKPVPKPLPVPKPHQAPQPGSVAPPAPSDVPGARNRKLAP